MPNDNYPEAVRAIIVDATDRLLNPDDPRRTFSSCVGIAIVDGTRSLVWELNEAATGMCLYYCQQTATSREPHTPGCVRRRALLSKWSAPSEEEKS